MATDELKLTTGEKNFYDFMTGKANKFYESLFNTILYARVVDKKLLQKAFPEEVTAVDFYRNVDGYWHELKSRIEEK